MAIIDEPLKIVIPGRPATKKNSSRIVKTGGFTRVLPSEAFEEYQNIALLYLRRYKYSFDVPVSLCCRYWLPNQQWWPDLIGLLQATSDIFEKAGVLTNDRLVADYNGSKIAGIDKYNPRAEIAITISQEESFDPYVQKKNIEKAQSKLFG